MKQYNLRCCTNALDHERRNTDGASTQIHLSMSEDIQFVLVTNTIEHEQGCIFRLTCSHPELTKDQVLTGAYLKISRTVTRNAGNKSV